MEERSLKTWPLGRFDVLSGVQAVLGSGLLVQVVAPVDKVERGKYYWEKNPGDNSLH